MSVCPEEYFHRPLRPDFQQWPFDVPSIMEILKQHQLTVVNGGNLSPAEIYSPTGQRWMDRALAAEANLRYATSASEKMIKVYEERLAKYK
jgi:hypothetical protein